MLGVFFRARFIGNLDLCGRQVNKPCHTSLGFPVVLPLAESDEVAAGTKLITFHDDLPYPSCEIVEKIESLTEEVSLIQEDTTLSIGWS